MHRSTGIRLAALLLVVIASLLVVPNTALAQGVGSSPHASGSGPQHLRDTEPNPQNAHRSVVIDEPAAPSPAVIDSQFVAQINRVRQQRGLKPLQIHGSLRAQASLWTDHMVGQLILAHDSRLGRGLPGNAVLVGENVGRGRTVDSLMRAFMASSTHRANLLSSEFDYVAVASKIAPDGRLYTTHRFLAVQES